MSVPMMSTLPVLNSWWRKGRRLLEEGETALASTALGEALRLRRGEPLAEFAYAGFADAERTRLDELTLVAIETRVEADLVLGRHGELVGELEALCREHPLRERLWELLMLALYRAGRQAEALRAYTEVRDRLVDELGIDPGPALRELEARILAQDPSLAAAGPAGLAAVPAPMATGNLREPLSSFVGRTRGARAAERGGPLEPAGDADRSRRGGQDPAGGRGGRHPARRAPRRRLAGRVRQRHRARRGCAGCGRRARGGRGRPRRPAFAGLDGGAHRAPPGRAVASGRPRQL